LHEERVQCDFALERQVNDMAPRHHPEIASEPSDGAQPLSSEQLARPFVLDAPADGDGDVCRELIVAQETRFQDLKRQHAEAETELLDRRRQLSDQEARAADLKRQHAEAETELVKRRRRLSKQEHWAAALEWLAHLRLRLVADGLLRLKSAVKALRAYLLTRQAFRWQQEGLQRELQKSRNELRKAREAVSDIERALRTLEDERVEQSVCIKGLARLVVEQEAVVAAIGRELTQQPNRIEELQRELVQHQRFENQPLGQLARSYRRDCWWPELQSLRKISMLHFETLYLLRSLAIRTPDAIIEVGPYIGGSTIALGRGLQIGGGGPFISIEMGGSYRDHVLPTEDIIADLKRNVEAYGLTDVVHLLEGFTTDAAVDAEVDRILGGTTIGLLFLDADGNVERDFELYQGRLRRGSILVYDDYVTDQAPEKQTTIKIWVDQAIASGFVENLGIYRWGAWVGRYWG
jgi:predicted O-methyltransferase YrrM